MVSVDTVERNSRVRRFEIEAGAGVTLNRVPDSSTALSFIFGTLSENGSASTSCNQSELVE